MRAIARDAENVIKLLHLCSRLIEQMPCGSAADRRATEQFCGNPFVVYAGTLRPNQSTNLVLEYFIPTRLPVANAIGTKPSDATRAVMTTGRSRVSAAAAGIIRLFTTLESIDLGGPRGTGRNQRNRGIGPLPPALIEKLVTGAIRRIIVIGQGTAAIAPLVSAVPRPCSRSTASV
jgi:hypothetical protein